jgi:hypothetical protein
MKKEMSIPVIREIFFLPGCDGDCFEHGDFSDPDESSPPGHGSLELTVLLFPV